MPIRVEVDQFAGRKNHSAVFPSLLEAELRRDLDSRLFVPSAPPPVRRGPSGYRGLRLRISSADGDRSERSVLLANGAIVRREGVAADPGRELESWVWAVTGLGSVRGIDGASPGAGPPAACAAPAPMAGLEALPPLPECLDAPARTHDHSLWDRLEERTNCYGYAVDMQCGCWHDLGLAGMPCGQLVTSARADGLVPLADNAPSLCGLDTHVVVLCQVGHPTVGNFHFLRRDGDGRWSHKYGADPVAYLDVHDLGVATFEYDLTFCRAFLCPRPVVWERLGQRCGDRCTIRQRTTGT